MKNRECSAEIIYEAYPEVSFLVRNNGQKLGEVDVHLLDQESGFVSGVSHEPQLRNGYMRPAALAVKACLKGRYPNFDTLFDLNNRRV